VRLIGTSVDQAMVTAEAMANAQAVIAASPCCTKPPPQPADSDDRRMDRSVPPQPPPTDKCPVCFLTLFGSERDRTEHVETCLATQEGEDLDEPPPPAPRSMADMRGTGFDRAEDRAQDNPINPIGIEFGDMMRAGWDAMYRPVADVTGRVVGEAEMALARARGQRHLPGRYHPV